MRRRGGEWGGKVMERRREWEVKVGREGKGNGKGRKSLPPEATAESRQSSNFFLGLVCSYFIC